MSKSKSASSPIAPPVYRPPQGKSVTAPKAVQLKPNAVIQRMQAFCRWCTTPNCHNGSICKGSGHNAGIYAGRVDDQKRLESVYGTRVSGATHQMEHPYGYKVLAGPMHQTGARAATPATREIEQQAPAYHEELRQHRTHEGTGNSGNARESGLNAEQYRNWQRTALADQNPELAMAINQMTYAHQALPHNPVALAQANNSYGAMVNNMGPIPFGTPGGVQYLPAPTDDQKFDMLVFRFQVTFKRDPTDEEQLALIAKYNLRVSWL
jgi:hypothetical protein